MNDKTRALLVIFLLLAAQLACSSPLPGQNGAGSQFPGPVYTFTSLPPFPTTTTPLPSPTATITGSPTPTRTPTRTATLPPTLPPTRTPTPNARLIAPVIARYLSSPPMLDGDWSEWKGLTDEYPANTVVWGGDQCSGAEDLSSSFHLGWDDEALYLAIKVRDEHYVQNAHGDKLYNGDSLELLLDTRLMDDYGSAQLSEDDFQLGLSAGGPNIGIEQEAYLWTPYHRRGVQKDIQIEARRESGLYRVEAAIPWTVLEMKPVAGAHYGFALSVSDNDDGDGAVQQCMVSNLPVRYPNDPTTWGDLLLAK